MRLRWWAWLAGVAGAWVIGFGFLRLTVAAPEQCSVFDVHIADTAAQSAVGWFERALLADGQYVYEYDLETDSTSADYNLVRHAGVTMSLYQYARHAGDERALRVADGALQYMLANLYEHEPGAFVAFARPGEWPKLGSSALMLAGLNLRRDATGDERYDETMRALGRFMVALQRPDGSFLEFWDPAAGAPVAEYTSRYATGEAFWALAQLHRIFPGEGWDEPAVAVATYLATKRDEAEGLDFPPWADQWASYGLGEMTTWPEQRLSDEHITYARSLAERFGFLVRVESRRGEDDALEPINGPRARGAGMGTWIEGLTSLWTLARADPRMADLEDDIAERAICGAAMLAERQYDAEDAADAPNPGLAEGAWFTKGITRMDDQQHALSGILLAAPIAAEQGR